MSETALLLVAGVPLLLGWILALVEVAVRIDLSRRRRLLWVLGLLLLPVIGLALYVLVRPYSHDRLRRLAHDGGDMAAVAFVDAAERHARGELDDDAYRVAIGR
ncbi:MAG: PLDc N-terminal domain-containing protein [Acidimicrobiia bacterium]|nr:PLDc N-terminal domain-containing protein [Acidimicrobiia bacterium]